MVDAAARLQAEQIAAQSEVDSLRLIYGDTNVRLRAGRSPGCGTASASWSK